MICREKNVFRGTNISLQILKNLIRFKYKYIQDIQILKKKRILTFVQLTYIIMELCMYSKLELLNFPWNWIFHRDSSKKCVFLLLCYYIVILCNIIFIYFQHIVSISFYFQYKKLSISCKIPIITNYVRLLRFFTIFFISFF